MNIKSNNTTIKDICLSLGHFCKYNQEELLTDSCVLSNSLNSLNSDYYIDSYGVLSKNKLLYKEPLILSNLKLHFRNENLVNKFQEDSEITIIESQNEKIFFFTHLKNINHKYQNTFLKTLSISNSSNIFFPKDESIIIITDSEADLKKYKKIFDKNNSTNAEIKIIKVPTKIIITNPQKVKKIIDINDSFFLSMIIKLSDLIEENLNNSEIFMASDNQMSLITKSNILLLNFIPKFAAPYILRFLQKHIGSFQFHKQILGINYLITKDNFKYSDVFEYQNKLNYLVGSKISNFKILKDNNQYFLRDLLSSPKNLLTMNKNFASGFSGNKILISNQDYFINKHSSDLLNLNTHSYVLTNTGLILDAFNNDLKKPFFESKTNVTGYVDESQLAMETFNIKNFKPKLPKLPKIKGTKLLNFFKKP